jgi:hypothetical protein
MVLFLCICGGLGLLALLLFTLAVLAIWVFEDWRGPQ